MPYAIAQAVAQPSVEVAEFAMNACPLKVVDPPSLDFIDPGYALLETHRRGFSGDGF